MAAMQEAMGRHFEAQEANRAGLGLELLPGVQKLLETLKVRTELGGWFRGCGFRVRESED